MSRALGFRRPKLTKAQERRAYEIVTARDGGRCQRCGFFGGCERDHRQNRDPFNTVPSNLHLLCGPFNPRQCHKYMTERPAEAMSEGFAVPRYGDPLEWPAWRFGVGWVLYFDEPNDRGEWWRQITELEASKRLHDFGVAITNTR